MRSFHGPIGPTLEVLGKFGAGSSQRPRDPLELTCLSGPDRSLWVGPVVFACRQGHRTVPPSVALSVVGTPAPIPDLAGIPQPTPLGAAFSC